MDELSKIVNGLSPALIQFRSQEYKKEFDKFKADLIEKWEDAEENTEEDTAEMFDKIAFRSFIMHKIASLDVVLNYIIGYLKEDEAGE